MALLAATVCVLGCSTTVSLISRAAEGFGYQRFGWAFLAAVAAGSSIWCTHFVAILAFEPGAPVELDATLTVLSLLVALAGSAMGIMVALGRPGRVASALGGLLLGIAISAMHYTGMMAYRVEGLVDWRPKYVFASIALAVLFSTVAMEFLARPAPGRRRHAAAGALVLAILGLHFTAMTAFRVTPLRVDHAATNGDATLALALAVAAMGLVVLATGVVSVFIDASVRAEGHRELSGMAARDALTGLPNRATLHERLDREIAASSAKDRSFALIAIDLDRFSEINDLNGQGAGDAALRLVAHRLGRFAREGAFVARFGGDEFAIVVRARTQQEVRAFLNRVRAEFVEPLRLEDADLAIGAGIGVAMYPDGGENKEALINNADLAMHRAKSDPVDKICFYQSAMGDTARARGKMTLELREAIGRAQLELHYQVQKSVPGGDIVGYEALVRWNHPEHGLVPPADFIPLAESTGLIAPIGAWVLRTACAQAAGWPTPYKIAVNLSPVQFAHPNLPRRIEEILMETGLEPSRLELELTESTVIADKQRTLETLRRIKALGVSIALDDFGAGYSSLETLRSFPFDKIKLDRFFMSEIETSETAKAILRAVLALGRSLAIPVLAEGIETEGQLAMLEREGCTEAQGYYLGRPAPMHQHLAEFARAAQERRQEPSPSAKGPGLTLVPRKIA